MRIERERLFRLKEKEAAERKKAEEAEKKRVEEAEKKKIEEAEKKKAEEEKKKAEETEKKKLEELEKRKKEEAEKKHLEEIERKRLEEEKKLQDRRAEILKLFPYKMPGIAHKVSDDHVGLNKAKHVIQKNDRLNQLKANFDKQLAILKDDKKKVESQSATKNKKNPKQNQIEDKDIEERRKIREEQRKKMQDDIKEQRKKLKEDQKKISPVKQKESNNQPNTPPVCSILKNPPQDPPLITDRVISKNTSNTEEEIKKKPKKSGKTKIKSKRKSIKKNSETNETEEKKQKPSMPIIEEVKEIDEKVQKEIDNFLLMRKEMEKLVDIQTPKENIDDDCADLEKLAKEHNEKDQDRDDVKGVLEEELEENCTPKGEPEYEKTVIEMKSVDDKIVTKEYLESQFGKANVQKIVSKIIKSVILHIIVE